MHEISIDLKFSLHGLCINLGGCQKAGAAFKSKIKFLEKFEDK